MQHILYFTPQDGSLKAVIPSYKTCSSAEATRPKLVPSLGPAKAVNVPVHYNKREIGLAQFLYISANPILRGGQIQNVTNTQSMYLPIQHMLNNLQLFLSVGKTSLYFRSTVPSLLISFGSKWDIGFLFWLVFICILQ